MTAVLYRPDVTARAVLGAVRTGMESMQAMPHQRLSDWSADHFYLSAESSHEQGRWSAYPFQLALMDWASDRRIVELSVKKAKRIGYTKILLALMAYCAIHSRLKLAMWQPTDDDRDSFVKSEVEPILRDIPAFARVRMRTGGEDTIKLKQFIGSVWHLLGGKAARAYRRITVAVAVLDELDAFDQQVEKSADPVTLARGRLEGAPFPKLVAGSTPRVKGLSHIEHRHSQAGAQMVFNIACPHCDVEHPLLWGGKNVAHGFKWDRAAPDNVWHVCPHCREPIRQADYLRQWHTGVWIDTHGRYRYGMDRIWRDETGQPCQPPAHVGAHVWTAYSPQRAWPDIVREFLEAHAKLKAGDEGPMQGFVNETLGEVWEHAGDRAETHELMERAEPFPLRTIPAGVLKLVAGVDVQDNRFELVVWGVGRGEETWTIDYVVLDANPADERDWEKLDAYLQSRYPLSNAPGNTMGIDAAAIDTGGHFTHQVYNFVRHRERRRIYAVRGDNAYGGPVKGKSSRQDVNWRGAVLKHGVKLWHVGTDTGKDLVYARARIKEPGPGCMHFSKDLPVEFYEQLTAEIRVLQKVAGGAQYRWVKRRPRNEVLDCTVYALFCMHALDLHKFTDSMWTKLEEAIRPANGDLFAVPPATPSAVTSLPAVEPAPTVRPAAPATPRPPTAAPRLAGRDWLSRL